jgi:hypothetical protein
LFYNIIAQVITGCIKVYKSAYYKLKVITYKLAIKDKINIKEENIKQVANPPFKV